MNRTSYTPAGSIGPDSYSPPNQRAERLIVDWDEGADHPYPYR